MPPRNSHSIYERRIVENSKLGKSIYEAQVVGVGWRNFKLFFLETFDVKLGTTLKHFSLLREELLSLERVYGSCLVNAPLANPIKLSLAARYRI